jgi:hypothetical protein
MAWPLLKGGPAQSKDNASQQPCRVRGTPEGPQFSLISMSVTLQLGGSYVMEQLGSHCTHGHEIRYLSIFQKFLENKYTFFWVIPQRLNSQHGESLK